MKYTIKNEFLTAEISAHGAQLQSLKTADGNELEFQGDKKWCGKSPVLFPIVGVFPEEKYTYDGKEYGIKCHGVAPISDYKAEKQGDNAVVFRLTSNPETMTVYPFSFDFSVKYELEGKYLTITLCAVNKDSKTMYCEMGTHTGFPTAKCFHGSYIEFESDEQPDVYVIKNNNPKMCTKKLIKKNKLKLTNRLFKYGAVTFGGLKSKKVSLVNKWQSYKTVVEIGNYPNLTFWSVPGASYVCIEPWSCESAHYCTNTELEKQVGICSVEPGESAEYYNKITYESI